MLTTPLPSSRLLPAALDSIGGAILDDARAATVAAIALVALIALADYATGCEMRLAPLYLLPVFVATWAAGWVDGVLIAALATLSWMVMFRFGNPSNAAPHSYWEGLVLLGTLGACACILARLRRVLDGADERFVIVLEELDAAVYVDDPASGAILYGNRRFRDIFGADGGIAHEIEKALGAGSADFLAGTAAARDAATARKGEFRDPASGRWFLVHARTGGWGDGRRVSLKVLTDISERKLAQDAGRQQMEKLQLSSKLITIGEMASALAHELNQPLTAIASYNQACVRMLRAGGYDAAELLRYIEKCGEQAVRAGSIINRMREFVRKREPMRSAHELNAIINDAVQMVGIEAERNGVEFELDLAPALPPVSVDAVMIEQVLLNLLRNAIEAMQQVGRGSRKLTLVSARGANAMLQVSLRDTGPGIPAEVAAHLYTPFFSTKPDGMGIGLNISRSIIEFHGGTLWHEPGADGGCTFHFTLPAQPA